MEYVRWEDHSPGLLGALSELYLADELIDCVLETEGGLVKGHRVILAACSPYFKDIFMSQKGVTPVPLREVNYIDMKRVLRIIYLGEVYVPVADVSSFFKTLKVLQITSLKRFVSTNFSEKFSYRNLCKRSTFNGGLNINEYIKENGEEVYSPEGTMGISDQEDQLSSYTCGVSKTKRICVSKRSSEVVADCKSEFSVMGDCANDKLRVDEDLGSVEDQLSPFAFVAIPPILENFSEEPGEDDGSSCSFETVGINPPEESFCVRIKEGNVRMEKDLMTESRAETEIEDDMDVCDVDFEGSKNLSVTNPTETDSESGGTSGTQTNKNVNLDAEAVGTDLCEDSYGGQTEDCGEVKFEPICDIFEYEFKEEKPFAVEQVYQSIGERDIILPSSQLQSASSKHEPDALSIIERNERMEESEVVGVSREMNLKDAGICNDSTDSEKINQQPFEGSDTCENEIDVKNYSQDEHPIKLSECLESFSSEVKEHHRFTPDFMLPISSFSGIQSECNLIERVQTPFGDNQYVCNICGASFIKECGLKTHMRTHTGGKTFMCTLCGLSFSKKRSINRHMSSHMAKKTFQCRVCEKSFSQNDNLKVHMRIHTGEKSFQCNLCEASFNQYVHLRVHMPTHTGERAFQCSVCERSFGRNDSLKVHMRIHTGEKRFKCNLCEASFNQYVHLRVHMSTHTGEKPFQCDVCDRSFRRKDTLKVHMRTHS